MSIRDFNKLTHQGKAQVILNKAIPLASITLQGNHLILYSLGIHFIEVTLDSEEKLIGNIAIAKGSQLDKYILQIHLCL